MKARGIGEPFCGQHGVSGREERSGMRSDERARVSVRLPHLSRPDEGAPNQRSAARCRRLRDGHSGRADLATASLPARTCAA